MNKSKLLEFITDLLEFENPLISSFDLHTCNLVNQPQIISIKDTNFFLFNSLLWIVPNEGLHLSYNLPRKLKGILEPINIVDKKLIKFFFDSKFSDNLIEMYISGDEDFEVFDQKLIYGEGLNFTFEFKNALKMPDISFEYIKLQPDINNYVLTFRKNNLLQFSKDISKEEFLDLAKAFNILYERYRKKEIKKNEKNFNHGNQ
ncbi:hypothetical protein [Paenibacillus kandeliae]|uniref:hypothetical protein n=1 Tax=Paenibacillus kandeliae TaxID=3231269 RepID=UPI00345846A1